MTSLFKRPALTLPALLASLLFTSLAAPAEAQKPEQTARLVIDANHEAGGYGSAIQWIQPLGQGVIFAMDSPTHGYELWTSNGTPAGTRLMKDMVPGLAGWTAGNPTLFGEGPATRLALQAGGNSYAHEIWITDATAAGTTLVYDAKTRGPSRAVNLLAGTPNGFFFHDFDPGGDPHTQELFFSDGTTVGTHSLNPPVEGGTPRFSDPFIAFTSGPWAYITASNNELWRSDGTFLGTTKLPLDPIPEGSEIDPHAVAAGKLFLSSYHSASGTADLWVCPMEGGTMTRLAPEMDWSSSYLSDFTELNGLLYFSETDDDSDHHLWVTDGTAAGTREIPIPPKEGTLVNKIEFARWHGSLYFTAEFFDYSNFTYVQELFRTDGTASGTTRLPTGPYFGGLFPDEAWRDEEDFLYFSTYNENADLELWRTKGDPASTRPAKGIPARHYLRARTGTVTRTEKGTFFLANGKEGDFSTALWFQRGKSSRAIQLTKPEKIGADGIVITELASPRPDRQPYEMLDGSLLAFLNTGNGYELWRMNPDGSRPRSIWKAKEYLYDSSSLLFRGLTADGRRALFTYVAYSNTRLQQLWVTDGTPRGTRLLVDHSELPNAGDPKDFVQAGGTWFYSTLVGDTAQLWKTDGTPAGTSRIVAADGTTPGPASGELVVFQDHVYFLTPLENENGKTALWRSDGTAAGTIKLKDTWHGETGEKAVGLSAAAGKLLFSVRLGDSQRLWQSDGTANGTVAVTPAAIFRRDTIKPAIDLGNGVAIFPAQQGPPSQEEPHPESRYQWWRHDSTGTHAIPLPTSDHHFVDLYMWDRLHTLAGSQVFYTAQGEYGPSLWVTDGTEAGTRELRTPGTIFPLQPRNFLAVGNTAYFSARDDTQFQELWRSDGTPEGTALVTDIGPGDSYPEGLKLMNGQLYFSAWRWDTGREIFTIDLPEH
ncbi:hypothetical protein [Luteolibacter soli]|uniref:ELWxxDGT repeat protein n=1 Tax=Luteolibacter soli TaxID=3135280 RepID=A0ABU9AVG2_9BACT